LCRNRLCFLQAEDGIRDKLVTGVQTCALPISRAANQRQNDESHAAAKHRTEESFGEDEPQLVLLPHQDGDDAHRAASADGAKLRSEERRVGKGVRSRWSARQCTIARKVIARME